VSVLDPEGRVRAALDAIVGDPLYGPDVLCRPQVLANLLSDYAPDTPRETGLLETAARAGVPEILDGYARQGLDPATAVRLAASSLSDTAAFADEACSWVVAEIARALGMPGTDAASPAVRGMSQSAVPRTLTATSLLDHGPQSAVAASTARGSDPAPRDPLRRRRSLAVLAAVAVILAATTFFIARHHGSARAAAPKAPAPDLARLVPASQRVLHVRHLDINPGEVPLVAVTTTTGTPAPIGVKASEDLLLLAWDAYAKRWTIVYNATRDPVDMVSQPDADTSSFDATDLPSPSPLIPDGLGVDSISIKPLKNQPGGGADLLVTATAEYAFGPSPDIAIIHYSANVARVVWAFFARGGGAAITGPPGHQKVAVTSIWATASDPQCCPARSYRFVLARSTEPEVGETYRVTADDRPWLGAIVTEQPPQSPDSIAVVRTVIPGSPADGILQPGDAVIKVSGSAAEGHGAGPAIFDQFAAYKPGQAIRLIIDRDGQFRTVTITPGSLANPKAIDAGADLTAIDSNPEYML
jgi:hypothetical protein